MKKLIEQDYSANNCKLDTLTGNMRRLANIKILQICNQSKPLN